MLDRKTARWAALLALASCLFLSAGCQFGGRDHLVNDGVIVGGGRFQLVIESGRTSVEGTHFLVDSATGDLWRLAPGSADGATWLRLASAPTDVAELDANDLFGVSGGELPERAED